jgi:hypothetical protein
MANKKLLNAPDLVTRQFYGKVGGKKVLVAIERSSKSLGLTEREEVTRTAATSAGQAAQPDAGRKKGEKNG